MEDFDKIVEDKAKALIEKESKPTSFDEMQTKYINAQVEKGESISSIATDFVKAKATSDIMKNEDGKYDHFHKELAQEQKETIKESFKQDRVNQEAKTLTAKQQKAEAFYTSFRPILEFDFSPLIHKKDNGDKEAKTYKDRSYGISLMVLMLALFVVPYCAFSIILALFNGVNAICEAIATFSKVARVIAVSVFIIAIGILIVYCALLGIDRLFGTEILNNLGL